jgi:outer membrane receptor protein involved in Fe transport
MASNQSQGVRLAVAAFLAGAVRLAAQPTPVSLPAVTVYSPSVANQSPVGAFAMPVSALRYEPGVDVEARNLAEAQSDLTIRGDTFENTGLEVGAVSLFDPQTGHYLAELPVAPAMLGAPQIVTGLPHALTAMNSTVGAVAYDWRPVRTAGFIAAALGTDGLNREEAYQGWAGSGRSHLAADADWAHAASNGTVDFGDSRFNRVDARIQQVTPVSQTDLFAGYQSSFLGWPNLYTPFGSDETDRLQTLLLALNYRLNPDPDDRFEAGVFYRRNKDDYAFSRFAPLGRTHPYQHTTWLSGVALGGRDEFGGWALNYHAEATTDFLKSTSLIFGRFHTRTLEKVALVPETSWSVAGGELTLKAGATLDRSDREGTAVAPVAELAEAWSAGALRRVYASYTETTEVPSYTALNSSPTAGLFLGNPNLGRETSRNTELGARGEAGGWTLTGAVFYRRDGHLVDWTYEPGVFARSANPVNVVTTGAEIVARRSWGPATIVLGCTALGKQADYLGVPAAASFYALNYARDRLTAAVVLRLGPGLDLRSDNTARLQEPDSLRTAGGNRAVVSSVGLYFHPTSWRGVELSVQADNLWNSAFQAVPAVPAAGRQVAFGAMYAW